jgi:UDPglucose--hexose-1-phosphate uridylyltransferase
LDRYAIIASARMRRPTDFIVPPRVVNSEHCLFCPGHERSTPPADLLLLQAEDGVTLSEDSEAQARSDWLVRCFPNMYPAAEPAASPAPQSSQLQWRQAAYGYHEIIVESPNHDESPGHARVEQLCHSLEAGLVLMRRHMGDKRIQYAQLFRNHRREAGASLSHTHSQIISLNHTPQLITEELEGFNHHADIDGGTCVLCKVLEEERNSPRTILENDSFLVLAPWASITPFELWIVPKKHQADVTKIGEYELRALAKTMRHSLGALARLLEDPPYNYGFHTAPKGLGSRIYHWHLEILPKLTSWAGFELSTGVYINVTPPEVAAASLRELVYEERDRTC